MCPKWMEISGGLPSVMTEQNMMPFGWVHKLNNVVFFATNFSGYTGLNGCSLAVYQCIKQKLFTSSRNYKIQNKVTSSLYLKIEIFCSITTKLFKRKSEK